MKSKKEALIGIPFAFFAIVLIVAGIFLINYIHLSYTLDKNPSLKNVSDEDAVYLSEMLNLPSEEDVAIEEVKYFYGWQETHFDIIFSLPAEQNQAFQKKLAKTYPRIDAQY